MAKGDVIVFDEAREYLLDGGFSGTDDIKCAVLDNTLTPIKAHTSPALGLFTEVGSAGSYIAGGTSLGTLAALVTQAAGLMTFDSTVNPTWAQDAANDVDAYWGLIYNDTDVGKRAIAFVDLGGPVDMTGGPTTINWNASGIFTI